MNFKSREKLLASVAALSLLGISPQQTFAAQITTNQAVQQTKKVSSSTPRATVVHHSVWVTSSVMVLTLQYLHCL